MKPKTRNTLRLIQWLMCLAIVVGVVEVDLTFINLFSDPRMEGSQDFNAAFAQGPGAYDACALSGMADGVAASAWTRIFLEDKKTHKRWKLLTYDPGRMVPKFEWVGPNELKIEGEVAYDERDMPAGPNNFRDIVIHYDFQRASMLDKKHSPE